MSRSTHSALALAALLALPLSVALPFGCGQPLGDDVPATDEGIIAETIPDGSFQTATETATEARVLTLVNEARKVARVCGTVSYPAAPPLAANDKLDTAARLHSQDMATKNFFSHTGSDGSTPWVRITRQGYSYSAAAENIAAGYSTPEAVVAGWLKSPGHCANIMNARYTQIGIGLATGGSYRYYWTQDFGRPN